MKNYYDRHQISEIHGNSFVQLDNVYTTLHEYYEQGDSVYYNYIGMYFISDNAKDETDRNNMFIKTYGISREEFISHKIEWIRVALLKVGEKYNHSDEGIWESYVEEYINDIEKYPYVDIDQTIKYFYGILRKCKDEVEINEIVSSLMDEYAFVFKGVAILLGDTHTASFIINSYLGDTRN